MKRKILTCMLTAALAASALLAGCGGQDGGDASDPEQGGNVSDGGEEEEITLKLFHNWTMDTDVAYFEEAAKAFHDTHPNVTIEIANIGDPDYSSKLKVMLGSDEAPDMFFTLSGDYLYKFQRAGSVLDLTKYYENDSEWNDSFIASAKVPFETGGGIYGVPFRIITKQMVYNKDLFEQQNVEVPTTWEEFMEVCETFKNAGILPQAFGDLEAWAACHFMTTFNALCVPDEVRKADCDYTTCEFTDPGYVQALYMLKDMQDKGYFTPNTNAIDFDVAREEFLIGNAAMAYLENIEYIDVENAGINAGIFSIPAPEGAAGNDKLVTGSPDGFAISSSCKHPELAVEFLKLLTSKEWQEKALNMSCTSSIKGTHNSENSNELMLKDVEICENAVGFANWMDADIHSDIADVYLPGMQEIIAGTVTPEELMEKVQAAAAEVRASAAEQ